MDSVGDKGLKNFRHGAEKRDGAIIRVGGRVLFLWENDGEGAFPGFGKI